MACGGGGAITKVEVENGRCRDVDEKKKSWERTMPIVSLSLISFGECIEKKLQEDVDALKTCKKNCNKGEKFKSSILGILCNFNIIFFKKNLSARFVNYNFLNFWEFEK